MDTNKAIEYLMHFGMSRQEATVYLQLIEAGKQTGYEIARDTGISRSNVYASLAALVEKGAAYLVEEDAKRYIPVHVQEFCGNRIRRMEEEQKWLDMNLTGEQKEEEGYVTIDGQEHISDKIHNLLVGVEERVYCSCSGVCLEQLKGQLKELAEKGKKVVLVTDQPFDLPGAVTYVTKEKMKMSKKPFVTKEQVEEIVKTYPTPFHLYDEKGIRENAKALKEAFAWNPGYKEYFAVKATPNPFLLQILKEYGCGCDCSSYTELLMSDAVGIDGHDIMFSSNDTPEEDFKMADELGAIINLDDITHIDFLEKTIGHIPETISCRYNPGGIFKISNDIMDNPGDSKYGMTTEQITEAFKTLKAKGAKEFGIHAFLASNTVTNDYYPMLAKVLFEQAVRLQKETGVHIKFINLSGGIGIPYTPDQEPNDIRVIGEGVRKVYEEVLVPAGMGDVAIYTELGRFMMGPYGCLVTKAIHEKNTYKNYIGVDACAVNLMRPAMYGAYHHITVLGKEDAPCDHKYDVTGSLCENNDKFAIDRMLPEVDMGDYLVIHDTGAHGFSMGYNYNGKLKSAELLLKEDGSVQMIRRAETPKDYFATFDCFEVGKKLCK